jgi:diguanylate cyclase (GGDEF)-like protein/PAS domain S-box-containing protein
MIFIAVANAFIFIGFEDPVPRTLYLVMGGFSGAAFAGTVYLYRRGSRAETTLKAGVVHFVITFYVVWATLQLLYSGGDVRAVATYAAGFMAVPAVFSLDPVFFALLGALDALFLLFFPQVLPALGPEVLSGQLPLLLNIILFAVLVSVLHYLITLELFLITRMTEGEERKAELALRGGNLGYWNWNLEGEWIEVDGRWFGMLGYPQEPGRITFEEFFRMVHPEDRTILAKMIQEYLDGVAEPYRTSFRMAEKDGDYRWIYAAGSVTERDAKGRPLVMHGIHQDIQQLRSQQQLLAESEARFKAYTENAPVGVCIVEQGSFHYVNPETVRISGFTEGELLGGVGLIRLVHPDDRHDIIAELKHLRKKREVKGEYLFRIVSRNGQTHWIESRVSVLDWKTMRLLISAIDVTERKAAQAKLQAYATYDELTGTYNRRVGLAMLEKEMHRAERERSPTSACFMDINGLKEVNDLHGHGKGDELILEVVKAVTDVMRKNDILCRLGGDEFLIIFPQCDRSNAEKIWRRIAERYEELNRQTGRQYTISVSHGISEYTGGHEGDLEDVLRTADLRMYEEKRRIRKGRKGNPASRTQEGSGSELELTD